MKPPLTVKDLSFRIGRTTLLQDVSFDVPAGQILVLLGSNGAGKSTLLQLLLGQLQPNRGTVEVLGRPAHRGGRRQREQVTFVPAIPDVYDWMTPAAMFRYLAAQYPTWDHGMVSTQCETLRIPLHTPFRSLSRGQAMKAMVLSAMAPVPRLLLLDEPFGGLDPNAKEELMASLLTCVEDQTQSILLATHQMDVAARLADRVVVLEAGQVTAAGPVQDLLPEQTPPQPVPKGLQSLIGPSPQEVSLS